MAYKINEIYGIQNKWNKCHTKLVFAIKRCLQMLTQMEQI